MLGRLRMSVDECIGAYTKLSDSVFRRTSILPVKVDGGVKARFSTKALEQVVKQLIKSREGTEDALLREADLDSDMCRV